MRAHTNLHHYQNQGIFQNCWLHVGSDLPSYPKRGRNLLLHPLPQVPMPIVYLKLLVYLKHG